LSGTIKISSHQLPAVAEHSKIAATNPVN
jgi:hypothetical protein